MTGLPTLRERAREAVRDEVSSQAWLLFASQGYAATTVDEVAEVAGMSRRTFFRYFESKDELVLERLDRTGGAVAQALQERPTAEAAWIALRRAFDVTVNLQEQHAEATRPLLLMLRDEPALRSVLVERRRRWVELLAPEVTERLPRRRGTGPDPRAVAVAGSAIACLESTQQLWAETEGAILADLLDEAMGAVRDLA